MSELFEWLAKQKRIPRGFLYTKEGNIRNLYEEFSDELRMRLDVYTGNKKFKDYPVILTGSDSVLKDEVAVYLLLYYIKTHRYTVKYYSHANEIKDFETDCWFNAIMRVDQIYPIQGNKIASKLIEFINDNRMFIISCNTFDDLIKPLGLQQQEFIITSNVVEMEIPKPDDRSIKL